MIRDEYILDKFKQLSLEAQVKVLMDALEIMTKESYKNKVDGISLAMGIPLFPEIESIKKIDGYKITVCFEQYEHRIIDFNKLFTKEKRFEKVLLEDYKQFQAVEVIEGTLAWRHLGIWTKDIEGNKVFHYYDIDPGLLYENSTLVAHEEAC